MTPARPAPVPAGAGAGLHNIAAGWPYTASSSFGGVHPTPFGPAPGGVVMFHTDIEDRPSILFAFDAPHLVRQIVVHNRADACQDRARSLAVEASADGVAWVELYAPADWQPPGFGPGAARIILAEPGWYKFIRLSLRERAYFHLQCVEVLAQAFGEASGALAIPAVPVAGPMPLPAAGRTSRGPVQPLRILLLSVHPVLEYDEVQMFEAMGHQVFCLGFYLHRASPDNLRGPLPETDWHRDCLRALAAEDCRQVGGGPQWLVSRGFCAGFDMVLVHHNGLFIAENWDALAGLPVVWRTIGQGLQWAENGMRDYRARGVKIVRWSPEERRIQGYIGADAVIRTAKDPADWSGWTGTTPRIVTFNNNFRSRGPGLSFDFHQQCVRGLPFDLYGLGNEDVPDWRGTAGADEQVRLLRQHRVAFVTGTNPAPYTLGFVEAWMTGIPVVHVGRQRFSGGAAGVYEIDDLIVHGESGFLVEHVDEARGVLTMLLADQALCAAVSARGRAAAIGVFGRATATERWAAFLREHVA